MNLNIKNQANLIREFLDSASDVGIIISENQNIDTVAAGLAFYLILRSQGKNVQVVSKKEPTVEISNLFGIDKVTKSFEGVTRILTISIPYREGEIEKVSYNIEENSLNVNLFAEENGISFSEKDVQYIKKGTAPSLIITIGVQNNKQLNGLVDPKSVKAIHIDISPQNSLMGGDVSIIDPSLSSLSEIVAALAKELSFVSDVDALQNLMDGIVYATRNFTVPNTSSYAFEAAGFLLRNGAKRKGKLFDMAQGKHDLRAQGVVGKPFDAAQGKPQDRNNNFPRSSGGGANQFQPRQQPITNYPSNNTIKSAIDPINNNPSTTDSIPEVVSSDVTSKDDVPGDWFLPKVFKGSR